MMVSHGVVEEECEVGDEKSDISGEENAGQTKRCGCEAMVLAYYR
jgi:hypothetical protein